MKKFYKEIKAMEKKKLKERRKNLKKQIEEEITIIKKEIKEKVNENNGKKEVSHIFLEDTIQRLVIKAIEKGKKFKVQHTSDGCTIIITWK